MNQETAVAVQDAAQVVERRANVQVGNIDMPMLVRLRRLFKTSAFLSGNCRRPWRYSSRSVLVYVEAKAAPVVEYRRDSCERTALIFGD
jgi:hypothetical protein